MLGIVVGIAAEMPLADALGGQVVAGGGDAPGAARAAEALAASGVRALLSFGLAGGLDPALPPGALVVPAEVVTEAGEIWTVDPALAARLGPVAGRLLSAEAALATVAQKRAAHDAGALAVDLESAAVARAAARHGLPFAVLRAVCDPAGRDLPPAALCALDARGRIRPGALLASLARQPGQIGALLALGREAARARRALLGRAAAIGPIA